MVNISNEKSMQSYTARCSRYKNKYTNLVCGKTAVGRNYNLPRDTIADDGIMYNSFTFYAESMDGTPEEIANEIEDDIISSNPQYTK
jgi:hypothetical protein